MNERFVYVDRFMCAIAEVVKCIIRLSPIGNKLSPYGTIAQA